MTVLPTTFILQSVQWRATLLYPIAASVLMVVVVGYGVWLYRGHFKVGSFYDAFQLATTVLSISLLLAVTFLLWVPNFPRGLALLVPAGALLLMATARWLVRASRDRVPATETARQAAPPPRREGVVGTGEDLDRAAAELGATTVILGIARADEQFLRELTVRTDALGLKLLVIPPVGGDRGRRAGPGVPGARCSTPR